MLVLNPRQRAILSDKLPDAANVAAGALVFGQFLGGRTFSMAAASSGAIVWIILLALSVWFAGGKDA